MGLSNFGVIMGGYFGIGILEFFGGVEAELISSPDTDFKFHSGAPV